MYCIRSDYHFEWKQIQLKWGAGTDESELWLERWDSRYTNSNRVNVFDFINQCICKQSSPLYLPVLLHTTSVQFSCISDKDAAQLMFAVVSNPPHLPPGRITSTRTQVLRTATLTGTEPFFYCDIITFISLEHYLCRGFWAAGRCGRSR